MATFELEIVTPGKTLYSGTVEHVGAPGIDGGFGVLSRHQQMVAALEIGSLRFREEGGEERLAAISGGFAEVLGDRMTVLAETAELAEDIDGDRAVTARDRAKERLISRRDPDIDTARAVAALERAFNRLRIVD